MNIPFSPPDIGEDEIREVVDTLKSGWITTGPKTKLFENKIADFCRTSRAVCLNSATACMETTLRILGVGPGDEVITTAYTYTATASVVCHVGAKLVLVDTAADSFQMDYDALEAAVTERTKVIVPVELGGVVCDYDRLFQIVASKKHLFHPETELQKKIGRIILMADAAHGFGAKRHGRMCGEIADFTCFSFHAVKNLTTAEGGAVTWRDIPGVDNEELYKQYMLMSLHGQSKDALAKTKLGAWEYDIVAPYYKCNMTDIMASIGLAQLKRYPDLLKRRRALIEYYDRTLSELPVTRLIHFDEAGESSGHLYLVRLTGKSREFTNRFISELAEAGVAANVHYKPLPMLSAYKHMGFNMDDYPNAFHMFENELTLPLHTCLTDEQAAYVMETFKKVWMNLC
jgi:dTDP-4-amino-4,6-dideoxygalactose transaminase